MSERARLSFVIRGRKRRTRGEIARARVGELAKERKNKRGERERERESAGRWRESARGGKSDGVDK